MHCPDGEVNIWRLVDVGELGENGWGVYVSSAWQDRGSGAGKSWQLASRLVAGPRACPCDLIYFQLSVCGLISEVAM